MSKNTPPTTYGLPKKKNEVIEVLQEAYANQNLEDQEYERRLDEATNAKSIEDLQLVIFDFPASIRAKVFPKPPQTLETNPLPAKPADSSWLSDIVPSSTDTSTHTILGNENKALPVLSSSLSRISAILSNQKLDFRLAQVPETPVNIRIDSYLSGTVLDLRNEELDGKHINIDADCFMGEVKILLPRGAQIQRNVTNILGEVKIQDKQRSWIKRLTGFGSSEPPTEIRLTVNITGTVVLGGIRVVY